MKIKLNKPMKSTRLDKKKTFNPLKMNGSYIGAIIGSFIVGYIQPINNIIETPFTSNYSFISFLIGSIIGFLIGWIIHLILRKYKYIK